VELQCVYYRVEEEGMAPVEGGERERRRSGVFSPVDEEARGLHGGGGANIKRQRRALRPCCLEEEENATGLTGPKGKWARELLQKIKGKGIGPASILGPK
jgi:hypothetical protein